MIDEDVLDDDVPLVDPKNVPTGTYKLIVKMRACSVNPCKVGIGYFETQATEEEEQGPQEVIDAQLDVLEQGLASRGYSRSHDREELWLDDDETKDYSIELNAAYSYEIWGVCDGDCGDLDLVLSDAYGNKIEEDVDEDAHPRLNPVNPATGPYTITVKMYDCEVEPCLVGITFYRK